MKRLREIKYVRVSDKWLDKYENYVSWSCGDIELRTDDQISFLKTHRYLPESVQLLRLMKDFDVVIKVD